MTVLDKTRMEVVYLEKLEALHAIGMMGSRVGGRAPAHCTAVGKVLLANCELDEVEAFYRERGLPQYTPNTITHIEVLMDQLAIVRRTGYAFDNEEHEPDVRCVAASVRDWTGQAVGAISIAGPAERMLEGITCRKLTQEVVNSAELISRALGSTASERDVESEHLPPPMNPNVG